MSTRLDDAIDLVAKQMTSVPADDALAARILDSLPPRSTWSLQWLMPRLAVLAMVVVAATTWTLRETTVELTPLAASAKPLMTELHAPMKAEPNRTKPLERLEPVEPLELRRDHDFALAALAVDSLDPVPLPDGDSLIVAPLEIADLPLTSDFPR